jgi:N-acetylmuramoyl-L-alanine amidase CwlA
LQQLNKQLKITNQVTMDNNAKGINKLLHVSYQDVTDEVVTLNNIGTGLLQRGQTTEAWSKFRCALTHIRGYIDQQKNHRLHTSSTEKTTTASSSFNAEGNLQAWRTTLSSLESNSSPVPNVEPTSSFRVTTHFDDVDTLTARRNPTCKNDRTQSKI